MYDVNTTADKTAAFSEGLFNKAETICLNKRGYSK